jgi:hypothetical protein
MNSEVRFRVLLAEGGAERVELARAQRALRTRLQIGMDALASMHNCIHLEELTFHAVLSKCGAERLELARTSNPLSVASVLALGG